VDETMTSTQLVTLIGSILTQIDTTLQTPGLSDADWQNLYALRKHLDDEQRKLVQKSINEANATYKALTAKLTAANNQLQAVIADLTKVATVINVIAQIAALVDQVLKLAAL
jgi:hypothetical protein